MTSDGVQLAYARTGGGPPLVKSGNWMTHLEFDFESPMWRYLYRELSRDYTLIRYDPRGNGLSDREVEKVSFETFVGDLETVVNAAGLQEGGWKWLIAQNDVRSLLRYHDRWRIGVAGGD